MNNGVKNELEMRCIIVDNGRYAILADSGTLTQGIAVCDSLRNVLNLEFVEARGCKPARNSLKLTENLQKS